MLPFHCTEPFNPLAAWMREAIEAEPRVPDAMQVASVDTDGRPSLRTVLLKAWGADGLVFYTNLGSRKAAQLDARPSCAVLLHWKSLERQVIAEGAVSRVSDVEADAYWATRPRGSQLGAWASHQSAPLASRDDLNAQLDAVMARFPDGVVPRPPFWGGYRLRPTRVEFWQGRADRLHDRCVFELHDDETWRRGLLQP